MKKIRLVRHHYENLSERLLISPYSGDEGVSYTASAHLNFLASRQERNGKPAYPHLQTPHQRQQREGNLRIILQAVEEGNVTILPDFTGTKRIIDDFCRSVCGNVEHGRCRRDKER